jgi:hypothetical protein
MSSITIVNRMRSGTGSIHILILHHLNNAKMSYKKTTTTLKYTNPPTIKIYDEL